MQSRGSNPALDHIIERLSYGGVPESWSRSVFSNPDVLKKYMKNTNADEGISEYLLSLLESKANRSSDDSSDSKEHKMRVIREENYRERHRHPIGLPTTTRTDLLKTFRARTGSASPWQVIVGTAWSYSQTTIDNLTRSE